MAMDPADKKDVVQRLKKAFPGAEVTEVEPDDDDEGEGKAADARKRKVMAMEDFTSADSADAKVDALLDFLRACGLYTE